VTGVTSIIATADRLAEVRDCDRLTREAVEFARDALGLERVSIFLSQPEATRVIMHGTWGTSRCGRTTDERGSLHHCSREDFESLRQMHQRGALWQYCGFGEPKADWERSPRTRERRPWLAVTPLIAARDVLGVMYNDTAITNARIDVEKQTHLALFASLLANLAHARLASDRADPNTPALTRPSRLVERLLAELEREPQLTGAQLAQRFRVSPGHLARTFKDQFGTSLVDHRNRMRLERFFSIRRDRELNLLEAALEAGFGSYSQFHRVHRQVMGAAPRDYRSLE
jgi:AraC-like DNA-binding protein